MVVTDYNEQFLDKRGTDHLIDELKAYIDKLPTGNVDLSDYVTKSELQAKLDALDINIDLSSYATKEELTQAINSIDLSAYAKKTDLPIVPTKVSELENDSNYLSSIPEEYVTETELNAKGYLTEHQDLSAYALKTEIPSLDGYATTQYVDNAIANVPSGGNVDLSNYYTKAETNALIPSTDGLATTEYVDNAISNIPTTDLSNYYTKAETYSKTEVDTLVANSGGSSSGGGTTEPTTPTPTPEPEPTPTPTHNVTIETSSNTIKIGGSYKSLTAKVTDANGNDVTSDYSNATFDWTCSIDGNDYTNNCTWRAGTEFNQKKVKLSADTDMSYIGKNLVVTVVISGSARITGTTTLEISAV